MNAELLSALNQWQSDARYRREVSIKIGGVLDREQDNCYIFVYDYDNKVYAKLIKTPADLEFDPLVYRREWVKSQLAELTNELSDGLLEAA